MQLSHITKKLRESSQLIGNIVALAILVGSAAMVVGFNHVSTDQAHVIEVVGATLGFIMWVAAIVNTAAAWRDMWWVSKTQNDDTVNVAKREFIRSVYRLAGKTCLTLALIALALARYTLVVTWLRAHPLAIFFLVLDAVGLFTIIDVVEPFWRNNLNRGANEKNK